MKPLLALLVCPLTLLSPSAVQDARSLQELLKAQGLRADLEAGVIAVPVDVLVRNDLLEYLLVGPKGAGHESLFQTEVRPSVLNAVALAAGFEAGRNAQHRPTDEGQSVVTDPLGEPSYLYAAWSEGGEDYFFRVEDLLTNLETGRSMRRHGWVFLGSRFATPKDGDGEVFLADLEENLINVTYFFQGNTLWTAALPECLDQTIWAANPWLVPARGAHVWLIVSRTRLAGVPEAWRADLPRVVPEVDDGSGR